MWCHRAICRKFSSIGQSHKFWGQSNAAEVHGFNRPAKLEQAHTLSEHTGPYPSYYKHTFHAVDATSHPQHSHALLVSTSQREHCRTQQHTHQKDGRAAGLHNGRKDMRSGTQHTMPKHTQGFKPHKTAHPLLSEAALNSRAVSSITRSSLPHSVQAEPTTSLPHPHIYTQRLQARGSRQHTPHTATATAPGSACCLCRRSAAEHQHANQNCCRAEAASKEQALPAKAPQYSTYAPTQLKLLRLSIPQP